MNRGDKVRPAVISGFSATAFAILGWAMPIVFPNVEPQIAKYLLYLAAALMATALLLWLLGLRKTETTGVGKDTQSTTGHGSAAIGANYGTVHITSAPTVPHPKAHRADTPDPNTEPTAAPKKAPAPKPAVSASRADRPDMPYDEVAKRVIRILAPEPDKVTDRRQLMDKFVVTILDEIVNAPLVVWGRIGTRAIEPIQPSFLRKAQLKATGEITVFVGYSEHPTRYSDLCFIRSEVDEIWPPAGAPAAAKAGLVDEARQPKLEISERDRAPCINALDQYEKFILNDLQQLLTRVQPATDATVIPRPLLRDSPNLYSFARSMSITSMGLRRQNAGALEQLRIDVSRFDRAIKGLENPLEGVFEAHRSGWSENAVRDRLLPLARAHDELVSASEELVAVIDRTRRENFESSPDAEQ